MEEEEGGQRAGERGGVRRVQVEFFGMRDQEWLSFVVLEILS